MLSDLAEARPAIERMGFSIGLVHMGQPQRAAVQFHKYGLQDVHQFSAPDARLYRAVGLGRGTFWQLFGPRVWWRGFVAGVVRGHGIGALVGDGFQMPGVFCVWQDGVTPLFVAESAADRPDYLALASRGAAAFSPTDEQIVLNDELSMTAPASC
jgi:hypothetical protein